MSMPMDSFFLPLSSAIHYSGYKVHGSCNCRIILFHVDYRLYSPLFTKGTGKVGIAPRPDPRRVQDHSCGFQQGPSNFGSEAKGLSR